MRNATAAGLFTFLMAWPCFSAPPTFTDITKSSRVTFTHRYGDYNLSNIVEGTGAGACVLDYDGDGFRDLYFVTGKWTKSINDNRGRKYLGKLQNTLYRNLGNGTFLDVTKTAAVEGKDIFSSGCSVADYDNDGDVDLYVLNYGRNLLYRNNGNGTFTEASRKAGLIESRWSLSAVWFDYNGDGHLDVYVGNYLLYDDGKFRDFYAASGYPGPLSYSGQPDALYRNNGNGTFTEVTKELGLLQENGRAMSVTAADLNNDGRLDIYVANDAMENYYFEQTPSGSFKDKGVLKGLAFSEHGQGVSSMGPVVADIDRNGLLDVFIPDLRYNTLLMQTEKMFEDRTRSAGVSLVMGQYSGWGAILFDYDNDQWKDIFTVHGHAHFEYVQEDTLLRNKGNGKFADVSNQSGKYFFEKYVGRGAAHTDIDNDGDVDLVVVNLNDQARILRNDGGNAQNWLTIQARLVLPSGTRTAVGARVYVTAGDQTQMEDLVLTKGYLSSGDDRLFFGLGKHTKATVKVRWPDGSTETRKNITANQLLRLHHETGKGGSSS